MKMKSVLKYVRNAIRTSQVNKDLWTPEEESVNLKNVGVLGRNNLEYAIQFTSI